MRYRAPIAIRPVELLSTTPFQAKAQRKGPIEARRAQCLMVYLSPQLPLHPTCRPSTPTQSDTVGEGLTYSPSLPLQQGGSRPRAFFERGERATSQQTFIANIHRTFQTQTQSAPEHNIRVSSSCSNRPSILSVFKRLADMLRRFTPVIGLICVWSQQAVTYLLRFILLCTFSSRPPRSRRLYNK